MVNSSKRTNRITNIKLEPYSVVTDTSTVLTDYASVGSNDSFYDNPYTIEGHIVFGPWPKPLLPVKSHSDSNQAKKLAQFQRCDLKGSSSEVAMDASVHYRKTSGASELAFGFPVIRNCGVATDKVLNNAPEEITMAVHEQSDQSMMILESSSSDEIESEHSIQMATPILTPKEQNKIRFQQLQQRIASASTPFVSMLGTKIEVAGESSTDHDSEVNKTNSLGVKMSVLEPQPAMNSNKSTGLHNDTLERGTPSSYPKRTVNLLHTASAISAAGKTLKSVDNSYQTALSQGTDEIDLKTNEDKFNDIGSTEKENYITNLMSGIGKILRERSGGIAALYKYSLEKPQSGLGKIVHSLLP